MQGFQGGVRDKLLIWTGPEESGMLRGSFQRGGVFLMKSLVILAHPERQSFCGALADTATSTLGTQGDVLFSDLHGMNWQPASDRRNFTTTADASYLKLQAEEMHASTHNGFAADLEGELRKVEACDLMVWVFPLWWFSVPALLKGWVDRVFVMGRVYGQGHFYENGTFKGKKALLCLTTGGPEEAYKPGGFNGDIHSILKPIQRGMLRFTGFDVLAPQIIYGPAHLDETARKTALAQWSTRLDSIAQESPIRTDPF